MTKQRTKEEMKEVWKEYKKTNDQELRDLIILQYLHLVKYVVRRVSTKLPKHVKSEDMYSTGVIGLIKAIDKYDIERKNKFETYAILLIRGAIIDEMRSLDWVPRSVHQKANKIAAIQEKIAAKFGREATDAEVAKELGVSLKEYDQLVERVRPATLLPLDVDMDPQGESISLAEKIPDHRAKTSFELADRREFRVLLEKTIQDLPEKEKSVLVLYYYEHMMLKEIGRVLGVSESRVSQIHTKALLRLRTRLQSLTKDIALPT